MEIKFLAPTPILVISLLKKLQPTLICLICQDPEEIEEIWCFWNPFLWTFEHCILSHNVSCCLVCKHLFLLVCGYRLIAFSFLGLSVCIRNYNIWIGRVLISSLLYLCFIGKNCCLERFVYRLCSILKDSLFTLLGSF